MAEYGATSQTINPGESAIFQIVDPCRRGLVRFRNLTGSFLLRGWLPNFMNGCPCRKEEARYLVDFSGNIAIPEGGTVGEISVALSVDGATVPYSTMRVTPAAVEEFFNVAMSIEVPVWRGCCETVTLTNTSDQPITLEGVIRITRPDLGMTY